MVQRKQIPLGTMRLWVQSLASLSGLRIRHCRELWCRSQMSSDPMLLWLWCRPAATAPIRPLAWEPPYAMGTALKRQNTHTHTHTQQQQQQQQKIILNEVRMTNEVRLVRSLIRGI